MIGWIAETLVASTMLMALVLVVRGTVRRRFGPTIAYALWLLPLARMVLPPLPGAWQLSRLLEPAVRSAQDGPGIITGLLNPAILPAELADSAMVRVELAGRGMDMALVPPTVVAGGPSVAMLLIGFWAVGAFGFLAYHLIVHRRFCRALLRGARVDRTVAANTVRVIETEAAHGPLAFGLWRKYVAFPRDFAERYDEVERSLALAHELGHHARGDLLANWAALIVLALHWFNPVAWIAFRAFRADQELACDALVLAGRPAALRHAYGRAIVKSAHGGAVSAACHLHTINDLKGRLKMLSLHQTTSRARTRAGAAAIAVMTLLGLGATASGTSAAERVREGVEHATGVTLAAPAPSAVPAVPTARAVQDGTASAPLAPHVPAVAPARSATPVPVTAPAPVAPSTVRIAGRNFGGDVLQERCGPTAGGSFVINRKVGDKTVMVICTDSIEKVTSEAGVAAGKASAAAMQATTSGGDPNFAGSVQRGVLATALNGLRGTRAALASNPDLTATARTEALADIDESIAEIEAEMGGKN